ncbi:MAG: hypothetical protein KAI43_11505 [Candidatus Aureabacteria bacterium]|nr:hypothetical protein [Candidatus Auribacterota bacterium]
MKKNKVLNRLIIIILAVFVLLIYFSNSFLYGVVLPNLTQLYYGNEIEFNDLKIKIPKRVVVLKREREGKKELYVCKYDKKNKVNQFFIINKTENIVLRKNPKSDSIDTQIKFVENIVFEKGYLKKKKKKKKVQMSIDKCLLEEKIVMHIIVYFKENSILVNYVGLDNVFFDEMIDNIEFIKK